QTEKRTAANTLPEKLPMQFRRLEVRAASLNKENRSVPLSFSSEEPVERSTFFGDFREILDHSPAAVRMNRLKDGAPLLFGHDSRSMDSLIGTVEGAQIVDKRGTANVRFAD